MIGGGLVICYELWGLQWLLWGATSYIRFASRETGHRCGRSLETTPMPKGIVACGFLFNHIYHHRGEMIVYLRATGNKVPGMYGPTYEEGKDG